MSKNFPYKVRPYFVKVVVNSVEKLQKKSSKLNKTSYRSIIPFILFQLDQRIINDISIDFYELPTPFEIVNSVLLDDVGFLGDHRDFEMSGDSVDSLVRERKCLRVA